MKNKLLIYTRNSAIGIAVGFAVGAGIAEIVHSYEVPKLLTGFASTFGEYLTAYSVFLPLHILSNKDLYQRIDSSYKLRSIVKDQLKLGAGLVLLNATFLLGRPFIVKEFMERGIDPAHSSLYTGLVSYPFLFGLSIPIAKVSGNLRSADSIDEVAMYNDSKNTLDD